jgi:hypothetical protein
MNRRTTLILTTMTLLCFAVALPTGDAAAQQKQRVSYKLPAQNTKYPQVHYIDLEDVPGHQVGVSELHRVFSSNAPEINGVKFKEAWTRSLIDFIDYNGLSINYTTYVLENGDKFFVRGSTMGHNTSGKRSNTSVGTITGGTGKLVGIRGISRSTGTSDPKAGFNETQADIEYWIEK